MRKLGSILQVTALGLLLGTSCSSRTPGASEADGGASQQVAPPQSSDAELNGAVRIAWDPEDDSPISVEEGQTAYLVMYRSYFTVPAGWSGEGFDGELTLTSKRSGARMEVRGLEVLGLDGAAGWMGRSMRVGADELWVQREPLKLSRVAQTVQGVFDIPENGAAGFSLMRAGETSSALWVYSRDWGQGADNELEAAAQAIADSSVFKPSPWTEKLTGLHLHDTQYLGENAAVVISTDISLCSDGWAQDEGFVDSRVDDPYDEDGNFIETMDDWGTSTAFLDSAGWAVWTAHGELEDGRVALHFADGNVRRLAIQQSGEEIRVGGQFWDSWEEDCSAPSKVASAFEEGWQLTLSRCGPSGFEAEPELDLQSNGRCDG